MKLNYWWIKRFLMDVVSGVQNNFFFITIIIILNNVNVITSFKETGVLFWLVQEVRELNSYNEILHEIDERP